MKKKTLIKYLEFLKIETEKTSKWCNYHKWWIRSINNWNI